MPNVNRRQLLKGSVATAGALALAGCTGDSNDGDGDGSGGEDALIQRAKQEGSVTVYTVIDQPDMESIFNPAFKEDYPWAKVNTVGLGPSKISSRMSSEHQADQVKADVAVNTQGTMAPLIKNGVFRKAKKEGPVMDEIQLMNYDQATYTDHWFPSDTIPQVLLVNTNKISKSEAPSSWQDLANSRWKNELVFDRPSSLNVSGAVFATLYGTMGESKWNEYMQGVASNQPTLTESASDTFRVLAQGEGSVGIGLLNNVLSARSEGSTPIRAKWLKPTTYLNVPIYMASNSPHPAMAELYTRWMVSASGQEAMAESGRVPPHAGVASYAFGQQYNFNPIPAGVDLKPQAYKTPSFFNKPDMWVNRFKEIFG